MFWKSTIVAHYQVSIMNQTKSIITNTDNHKQTDSQSHTHKQTVSHTHKQTDTTTHKKTHAHTDTHKQTDKHTPRHTDTHILIVTVTETRFYRLNKILAVCVPFPFLAFFQEIDS